MLDLHKKSIISLYNVSKRYGKIEALRHVSLEVMKNEFVFVTGPSGAGKSTLIKLLYMGEAASSGGILVNGMNIARFSKKQIPILRRSLGIVFQDFKLINAKSVFQNIALVLEVAGVKPREIESRVMAVLEHVGIENRADEFPPVLSGGEKQRVAVARAMVGNPEIILADEPTGSLDPDSAAHIFHLLRDIHERGATVIVATHDQQMIDHHAGRVIRLVKGCMSP